MINRNVILPKSSVSASSVAIPNMQDSTSGLPAHLLMAKYKNQTILLETEGAMTSGQIRMKPAGGHSASRRLLRSASVKHGGETNVVVCYLFQVAFKLTASDLRGFQNLGGLCWNKCHLDCKSELLSSSFFTFAKRSSAENGSAVYLQHPYCLMHLYFPISILFPLQKNH